LALHYSASENTLFQPCIWPPQFAASGEAIAGSMRSISPTAPKYRATAGVAVICLSAGAYLIS
jgi:hypothetical protein